MPANKTATAAFANLAPEPGIAKPDPILIADNVRRSFGGLNAVSVDHLEIQRGAITALIGPNGAGKTTLFNLLTGFDQADEGVWTFQEKNVQRFSPNHLARIGMVRTFQLTKALSRMTVLDNVRLGARKQLGERILLAPVPPVWRRQETENTERAMELLARFNLQEKAADFAGSLSGGQRKLLEMARALMTDPDLIMLDEPMAGVNPALTQSLLQHIKNIRDEGKTVFFVEHDMDMVHDISEWVVVMAEGQVIAEGLPDVVMRDTRVIDAYLGAHHDEDFEEE
jgi:neutral amino acid transport system ATP-binding protein